MNSAPGLLCPSCRISLVMSERSGIEIDYCPQCRGIWLDRGELDKIVERATRESAPAPQQQAYAQPQQHEQPHYQQNHQNQQHYQQGYDPHYDQQHGHRRKKSFLQQLFD